MNLTYHELYQIFKIVINYFNQKDVREISFAAEDYYTSVWRKDIDFDNPEFLKCLPVTLGSLYHDFEVWKEILNEEEEEAYISGVILRKLGGILTAFGQVSDKLDNPTPIKNIPYPGYPKEPPPALTIEELQKIFNVVIESLKVYFKLSDISFEDPRYIKFALKKEYVGMDCPPYTIESLDAAIQLWKEILSGKVEPSALAIEKLGDILTAFGEELG